MPLKIIIIIIIILINNTNRSMSGYKQGDALTPLLFNFALEYAIRRVQLKPGWLETKRYTSASGLCR